MSVGLLAAMDAPPQRMPMAVRRAWLLAVLLREWEPRWELEERGLAYWSGQATG